jgi:ABC-2 type transport system permease protein
VVEPQADRLGSGPDAPTRRGVHERLIAQSLADSASASTRGYRANRTLSLRVETVRQLRRRRTQVIGLLVLVLPILIALAFKVGGGRNSSSSNSGADSGGLVDLARTGAANFALFTEFAVVGFLLVVIVALFCGDTVASEASWSSLRYLLALPVPRGRLLRQKLTVALGFTVAVNVLLPFWAYLVGGAFFGWAPARSPVSGEFGNSTALVRLGIVVAYATVQMLTVAALAFLLSVLTDAPLGAVGGATFLVVISNILDSITALDPYRRFLPTHFQYSWLDALGPQVVWSDMIRGTGLSLIYSSALLLYAWRRFLRKDITS